MPLRRAKQACVHCHRRRIRCDVLQQRPCSNCIAQEVPCEIGVSRRGKYPRKKSLKTQSQPESQSQSLARADIDSTSPSIIANLSPAETTTTIHTAARHASHTHPYTQYTLSSDPNPARRKITEPTVFLGESSPLTSVMDPTQPPKLHYALPDRLLLPSGGSSARDEAVRLHAVQQAAQLESDGSLSFPPRRTVDALLKAYFRWFHPCFPIVDRGAIYRARSQPSSPDDPSNAGGLGLPPLLLQAMLFIGVSLCDDRTFSEIEYPVRYRAKFLFYSRAKAIYEADAESNPIVKLQALFMLSFWRGGPSEERDVRFWLGVAISLAQKRGMHMMSRFSHPPKEMRVWKRIWWALYTRDQQSAAALGLPPRIRDEDGDVAMLEPDDILEEETLDDDVVGQQKSQDLVYPIEMAKLARLLRTIVSTQYLHHQKPDLATRNALNEQLCLWESQLPPELRLENGAAAGSPDSLFLTGLLHMTYQNLYILLHRNVFLNPTPHDNGQIALDAATKSTRIMEDMLSHRLIQHAPTHLITHAFSTLCIHTIHHRRSSGTMRTLAEHRARLCLLSLEELQKSWDLENWVLHLFFKGLDDRTAESLGLTGAPDARQMTGQSGDGDDGQVNEAGDSGDFAGNGGGGAVAGDMPMSMPLGTPQDDLYGWVPWEDEADALNLQNLEFLYRFL
ncbi:Zn(II)2Cys6 transcription factor [Aspergillus stella-maris]|uniref:Zn(II)2Cys6 transcription factor n=1 Tax=Aspergillus stella-maris TaxID=1810926 RepID=UPI003CCD32EF